MSKLVALVGVNSAKHVVWSQNEGVCLNLVDGG